MRHLTTGKRIVSSGMKKEIDRCGEAVRLARQGLTVSLVSSGDAGVYGMAGLAIEIVESEAADIDIEIVPGITAASAAAAKLGAPLMLDFACISLSDLLVPWGIIVKRLEAVATADLVVVLYNPKSKKRTTQIEQAREIFLKHRPSETPVGVCTAIGSDDEKVEISKLGNFLKLDINMRSIIIIGNTSTRIINGKMVTHRGYRL
jgi:precorrin-3B C17-methyltransferase